jgi:hypothetical protein
MLTAYRYALNLVHGHRLVFNVGERVEGYTNLLWTLLVAAGIWQGADGPTAGHVLSEFFGAGALLATCAYARTLLPAKYASRAALAPLVLYAPNAFMCWTTSGLATPLFLRLTIGAVLMQARGAP